MAFSGALSVRLVYTSGAASLWRGCPELRRADEETVLLTMYLVPTESLPCEGAGNIRASQKCLCH